MTSVLSKVIFSLKAHKLKWQQSNKKVCEDWKIYIKAPLNSANGEENKTTFKKNNLSPYKFCSDFSLFFVLIPLKEKGRRRDIWQIVKHSWWGEW